MESTSRFNARIRRGFLVLLLAVFVLEGIRGEVLLEGQDGLALLLSRLAIPLLLALWCLYDGRVRGKSPPHMGVMAIFLVAPVAVPYYFFWSRGLRGAVGLILLFVAIVAAYAAGMALVWVVGPPT